MSRPHYGCEYRPAGAARPPRSDLPGDALPGQRSPALQRPVPEWRLGRRRPGGLRDRGSRTCPRGRLGRGRSAGAERRGRGSSSGLDVPPRALGKSRGPGGSRAVLGRLPALPPSSPAGGLRASPKMSAAGGAARGGAVVAASFLPTSCGGHPRLTGRNARCDRTPPPPCHSRAVQREAEMRARLCCGTTSEMSGGGRSAERDGRDGRCGRGRGRALRGGTEGWSWGGAVPGSWARARRRALRCGLGQFPALAAL